MENASLIGMLLPLVLSIISICFFFGMLSFRRKTIRHINWLIDAVEDLKSEVEEFKSAARNFPPPRSAADTDKTYSFPDSIGSANAAYKYDDVSFDLLPNSTPSVLIGKPIDFKPNGNGVSLFCSSVEIGSLSSGRISSMIADWLRRGDPYRAIITHAHDTQKYAAFDIVFYRTSDE